MDLDRRRPLLPNLTHPEYPITPEAAQSAQYVLSLCRLTSRSSAGRSRMRDLSFMPQPVKRRTCRGTIAEANLFYLDPTDIEIEQNENEVPSTFWSVEVKNDDSICSLVVESVLEEPEYKEFFLDSQIEIKEENLESLAIPSEEIKTEKLSVPKTYGPSRRKRESSLSSGVPQVVSFY
ncbi:hypothetical protein J6590_051730 [Homalodisca vitripennis]|nr:hypothetical protein J6590_051730 [Homalodisca vitripennis]